MNPRLLFAMAALAGALASSCGPTPRPTPPPATPASIPASARASDLSLFDVDCAECADRVVVELKKEGPIYQTTFDKKRVVLHVFADPIVSDRQMLDAVKRAGFRAEIGGRGGAYLEAAKTPEGSDVSTSISDGSDVPDLTKVLVSGKTTIVDFYADWCGPCRNVDKHVKGLIVKRPDVAYRRLNIVDWDSPLAKHYMKDVTSLPYVVVFAPDGRKIDAIAGLDLARLDKALGPAR